MDHRIEFDVSALDIHLPHAGEIIEKYRRKYTTDGAEGMPPHITLLYPFLSVHEYTQRTHNRLVDVTSTFHPFYMSIGGLKRFPGVLYLEVSHKENILHMIQKLVHEFPSFLPYGGKIPLHELTPHITIAVDPSEQKLDVIEQEFTRETGRLPIESVPVDTLSFSVRTSGQWIQLSSFQFKKRIYHLKEEQ